MDNKTQYVPNIVIRCKGGCNTNLLGHISSMLHGFNGIYAYSQACIMLAVTLGAEALRMSVDSTPVLLYVGIRMYVAMYCGPSI